jgi:hypothetical protein
MPQDRSSGLVIVLHELLVFVFQSDLVSIRHDFVLAAKKFPWLTVNLPVRPVL